MYVYVYIYYTVKTDCLIYGFTGCICNKIINFDANLK